MILQAGSPFTKFPIMFHAARLFICFVISLNLYVKCFAQNYVFAQLKGSPVNTKGWNFQGGATVANITGSTNSELLLCPLNSPSGAIFYNKPINLSVCSKWKAEFDFRMYDGSGADGFAFCFLDVPPVGFVPGGGLGIPSTANGLKICFDTWNNCISYNPTTVHKDMPKIEIRWDAGYSECANQPTKNNSDGGISFIRSSQYNHAKVIYDNGNIGVYVNDSLYLTGVKQFNYTGYLGFTASTGGSNDNHSIKNVIIYTDMPPSIAGTDVGICPDKTLQLGTASNSSYTYTWSPSDGLNAANIANPILQLANNSGISQTHLYTVKTAFSDKQGCASEDSVLVTIYPKPAVHFTTPAICLRDATALFTDSSYTSEATSLPFSYLWHFGDPNATNLNPNTSTNKNPSHKYTAASHYPVSLQVTNSNGCSDSLSTIFTVNGDIPTADFNFVSPQILCNNLPLQIQNTSTVNFGSITAIDIAWGDTSGISYSDTAPFTGKKYAHHFPRNQIIGDTTFTIQYKAYSGISCFNEVSKSIHILKSPVVSFNTIPAICGNALPIFITQAKEQTGLPGNFIFSGNGIETNGLFTPAHAGEGISNLNATYFADNGCADAALQAIQVWPVPMANAGPDLFILEGGSSIIEATASGTDLQYNWIPTTNLNNGQVLTPLTTPTKDISYILKVTGIGGCNTSDTVQIKVLLNPHIPNVFSPNGDGINDTWQLQYLNSYPNCEVDVYNRYGQHIFHSNGYNKPWDGTFNGSPLPVATYYYTINTKKHTHVFSGSVTIIR